MFLKNLNSLEIKFIKQIILTFLKGTFFFPWREEEEGQILRPFIV